MKFVKLSQDELREIADFYKEVMSTAYEGLFFREGKVVGRGIMNVISQDDDFREKASKLIKARGWVDNIELEDRSAVAEGSVEVTEDADQATCHRLRGILAVIYEEGTGNMVEVEEVECESTGGDRCKFEIELKEF